MSCSNTPACSPPGPAVHRRGLRHLLRRGPRGRGPGGARPTGWWRCSWPGRRETVDVEPGRPRRARRPGAGPRRRRPRARWIGPCREQRADRLPLPVHRGRGAGRSAAAGRPGRARPGPRWRRAARCGRPALERCADTIDRAATAMADRFARRRSPARLRQRRQRHRRRRDGRPVPPPAARAAPAGPVARRRPGRAHRPGQRRRLRAGLLPADHRPRPRPATSPSASPPAATRSTCCGPSRRPHGAGCSPSVCAATRRRPWPSATPSTHCLVVPLRERAPDPGGAGRADAGSCGRAVQHALTGEPTSGDRATARDARRRRTARRRSSSASRPSAGAGPACSTTSSPWPTAPGARRRPHCSTPCSCPPSPTSSAGAADRRRRADACPRASGWPSAPTPTWSSRCASREARPVTWPCTAPSTTWP